MTKDKFEKVFSSQNFVVQNDLQNFQKASSTIFNY